MNELDEVHGHFSEEVTGHVMTESPPAIIWRYTIIATIVSFGINLMLYVVGRAADWIPDEMPRATETFSLISVILASVIPVLLFGALMVYLANHAPRASRLFTIVVTVVLIIAVVVPMTLPDIEQSFRFLLVSMHIVTAGSCLMLTRTTEN